MTYNYLRKFILILAMIMVRLLQQACEKLKEAHNFNYPFIDLPGFIRAAV